MGKDSSFLSPRICQKKIKKQFRYLKIASLSMFSISLLFLVFPIFPFSQFLIFFSYFSILIFCYFTWRNGIHIYSMLDQIQSGRLRKTDYCGLTCAINTHQRFAFSTGLTGHVDDFATLSMSNHLLGNCLENFEYYVGLAYV